ncbi:HET-domain-containing protein [Lophium mytilinum]|uniref:HET-domain-containing protein n=1 Tax=Lophium mytilinum TaxID=390894 RepID=A0A6A6QCJ0_9PEZI|nr:HET-domain-containing protein [Lophium mytilinum]
MMGVLKENEIRVLTLEPGAREAPLVGSLVIIRLDRPHSEYNALSYRWQASAVPNATGDPSVTANIELDGDKAFAVTKNAESALRHLRLVKKKFSIWIDAICIDQENWEERTSQVRMMGEIYSQAERVYIWLDIDLPIYLPAFEMLEDLLPPMPFDLPSEEDGKVLTAWTSSHHDVLGDDPEVWEPLLLIGENEYWTRVWIQQEIAFAETLTIQCRDFSINASKLHQFQELVSDKISDDTVALDPRWERLLMGHVLLTGVNRPNFEDLQSFPSGHRYRSLLQAVTDGHKLVATDPRDKIYAVLGLIQPSDAAMAHFPIDYRRSVDQVHLDVARFMAEVCGSVAFLAMVEKGRRQAGLPTWLPNWDNILHQVRIDTEEYGLRYWGEHALQLWPKLSSDSRILTVYSLQLDAVAGVLSTSFAEWGENLVADLCEKLELGVPLFEGGDVKFSEPPGALSSLPYSLVSFAMVVLQEKKDVVEEWIDTLSTDVSKEAVRQKYKPSDQHGDDAEDLDEEFQNLSTEDQIEVELRVWQAVNQKLRLFRGEWRLGMSKQGSLIRLPPQARPGDQIYGFLQCPASIVLRPIDGTYFEVIGACWLAGVEFPRDIYSGEKGVGDFRLRKVMLV